MTSGPLGRDPDVQHLRTRIGLEIRARITTAPTPDPDTEIVESLEFVCAGALMRAGMGHESATDIADRIERSARLGAARCADPPLSPMISRPSRSG